MGDQRSLSDQIALIRSTMLPEREQDYLVRLVTAQHNSDDEFEAADWRIIYTLWKRGVLVGDRGRRLIVWKVLRGYLPASMRR